MDLSNGKVRIRLLNTWVQTCPVILPSIAFPLIVRPDESSHHSITYPLCFYRVKRIIGELQLILF
ncbi:hypothetical protein RhiirA5_134149 [Rhizophagus irregularis]|uniref:Uncharacterized protein n=1 Tax=Rhizophagus irregularis TaxID=588596 RepID=A0A2N0PVC3_9GLOM|nr:hypothetical protein RhiirA5_134149 [Rhizophagus irregularis]